MENYTYAGGDFTRPGRQQVGAPWPDWRLRGLKDITYWPEGRHVPEHTGASLETLTGLTFLASGYLSGHAILSCPVWLTGYFARASYTKLSKTLYLSLSVTVDYLQLLSPSVDLTTSGCFSRHLDFRATTHSCLGQCLIRTEVGVYRAGAWGMHSSLCTLGGTCIKSGDTCDLRLYLRRRNTGTVVMEEHSRDCQIQNVSWGGWDGTGAAGDT